MCVLCRYATTSNDNYGVCYQKTANYYAIRGSYYYYNDAAHYNHDSDSRNYNTAASRTEDHDGKSETGDHDDKIANTPVYYHCRD